MNISICTVYLSDPFDAWC